MIYKHESSTRYVRVNGRMYRVMRGMTYEVVPDSKALAPVKGNPVGHTQMSASVYESITGKPFEKPKPPAKKAAAKAPAKKKARKKTASKKTVKKNGDSD